MLVEYTKDGVKMAHLKNYVMKKALEKQCVSPVCVNHFNSISPFIDKYLVGYTDFQKDVFKATLEISFGKVRTYAWIAEKIGRPRAARAVGQALKKNPLPFIIPCHRVIASDGTLGGFSMGRKAKKRLLDLEKEIREDIVSRNKENARFVPMTGKTAE